LAWQHIGVYEKKLIVMKKRVGFVYMRVIQIEYKNLFSKMPVDELEDNKQI